MISASFFSFAWSTLRKRPPDPVRTLAAANRSRSNFEVVLTENH